MRHTKIVATLGPATDDGAVLEALVAGGLDVARLNFSHGSQSDQARRFHAVREAAKRTGRHVAILQDLGGAKIRTGRLAGGTPMTLTPGARLVIAVGDEAGGDGRVTTTYAELARAVLAGDRLLLDDGRIELEVESTGPGTIDTRVVEGGELGERKGITAPRVRLSSGLTVKDASDLAFGLALGVDLVAVSFVCAADDITRARAIAVDEGRGDVPFVAKLERPEAIDRLDDILGVSDAVMVARGDLGLELPLEQVPRVQKDILRRARHRGVPVIVATQVLESMTNDWRPTRAEVSDAAGAVDGGADAVMLSGETAVGRHPVRVVEVLDAIIRDAEMLPPAWMDRVAEAEAVEHGTALCDAAVTLSDRTDAAAIVAVTREGRTARLLSARRPHAPVVAATDRDEVARRLALWRGVVPMTCPLDGDIETVMSRVLDLVLTRQLVPADALVVAVNATPELDGGGSNFLRIRRA